ncbi:flagellar FliJ family protein [Falsiroseomonas ponticola]|jgi:flagellar export protein FliJ|uniref:flagellar FliJ family protein n=1 Tax=Falsiroseomonas ponticola TaxID=2786951 RepID=UPI001931B0F8|nr:flagellar FliJ family protein [Roseomonas ponticola]
MARRDPLAALLKLRGLEVAAARRDLVARQAGAAAAAAREAAARRAMEAELAGGGDFADSLAAWLPLARAARERAAGEAALASQAVEAARSALAQQRARERAVEWLLDRRAQEARDKAMRAEQNALDEAAQRRGQASRLQ